VQTREGKKKGKKTASVPEINLLNKNDRLGTLYLMVLLRKKLRAAARGADYRFVVMFF